MKLRLDMYDYLIISLLIFIGTSLYALRSSEFFISTIVAVLSAVLTDLAANYLKNKKIFFPKTGLISGLIVSIVLSSSGPLPMVVAGVAAVLSKHMIKIEKRHVFNPANFGVLLSVLIFATASQSWWGTSYNWLVLPLGMFVSFKARRLDAALSFLIAYTILFLVPNLLSQGLSLNAFYSSPLLFYTFVMVVEPATTPIMSKGRVLFGVLVAVLTYLFSQYYPDVMFLGALFVADLFVPLINKYVR